MTTHFASDGDARFDPVAWWARVDGARTALVHARTEVQYSYADVDAEADRWCAWLLATGVQVGDRVAVLAQNRAEFIPLLFGCIRAGAMLLPLNWRLSAAELSRVLSDADPVLLLAEEPYRALACDALARVGLPVERVRDFVSSRDARAMHDAAREQIAHAKIPSARTTDGALLLYTSGSTGVPKGVVIPHRQLFSNAVATVTGWKLGADDVGPAVTPFFHTGGWNVFTTPLLFCGGAVVLIDRFDADDYLEALHRYGVTVTFGVPTQLAMLSQSKHWGRALPRLRWFIAGGAPCPQRLKDAVRSAGYRFREGYGLTECGPNCFATTDDAALARPGTVGWPIPFLEVRLRGDDGTLVHDDAIGELELRGPQLFGGYFRADDRSADVMTDDGFLRTGDLARRDADGCFAIRGRRKEMFISGGENVFPGEVEAAILDCAQVADVCVVGVPDAHWGEVGCAVVVRRSETESEDMLDQSALVAHARSRLAGYKVPKHVRFVESIPRLGSGKVDRAAVMRRIEREVLS